MMAKLTDKPPEGEQWTYEVKWDGYRALLVKDHGHVQLRSRNDNNLTSTYPTIHAAALKLKAETALLDGEIVALDPNGKPAFQALQHRAAHRNYAIVFYAFDLLHLDGRESIDYRFVAALRFAAQYFFIRALTTLFCAADIFERLRLRGSGRTALATPRAELATVRLAVLEMEARSGNALSNAAASA